MEETAAGPVLKKGKFSRAEEEVLRAAAEMHIAVMHDSGASLDALVTKRGKPHDWKEVNTALPSRSQKQCQDFLKRHFHPRNHKGPWTDGEVAELKQLHALHGSKWSTIAEELGRERTNVRDKWRKISSERSKGPWAAEEDVRLLKAIERAWADRTDRESWAIPWVAIAEQMDGRSPLQLRTAWQRLQRVPNGSKMPMRSLLHMVESIARSGACDETEVVWADFGRNARRRLGFALKRTPGYSASMPFRQAVALLRSHLLATLDES